LRLRLIGRFLNSVSLGYVILPFASAIHKLTS
jgi:hypothetical protein